MSDDERAVKAALKIFTTDSFADLFRDIHAYIDADSKENPLSVLMDTCDTLIEDINTIVKDEFEADSNINIAVLAEDARDSLQELHVD